MYLFLKGDENIIYAVIWRKKKEQYKCDKAVEIKFALYYTNKVYWILL